MGIKKMDQPKEKSDSDETRLLTNLGHKAKSATTDGQKSDAPAEPEPEPESKSERIKGVGDTLNGRFVLEECLGFGGMGMVYKALDLRKLEASDRKPYIAIKVLNVQFRGHPKSLIALQREAKKAQSLAHPNIVTVYDFDRDGAMVYLTMELLSGKSLQNLLHAPDFKGLSFAEALPIITGIAKALAHAHERGFVHCDLKPANVYLTDTGVVKVIDFGIARVFRKSEEDLEATVFDPGSLGGMTPTYASAEMLEHRDPDPRDDIYALGCITYELLTGRHPFNRLPATQARGAGLKLQRPKDLEHRQWQALRKALAFDREKRTLTVPQFLHGIAGQHRPGSYVALAGGAIVITLLLVAAVANKWESMRHSGNIAKVTEETPVASVSAVPASEKAPQARESVAAVLASIPCSALTKSADGSGTLVQGYLAEDANLAQLKERLGAADGVNNLKLNVRQVNKDYCPVISALAPYWRSNQETGGATSIHTKGNNEQLIEGDSLIMNITTPGYDAYVNIDYYVLDGSVVHLVPSPRAKANQAPSNYTATIGSPGSWVVSKPFGSELIALLITPVPLFDNIRPEHESRAAYLQAIEKQLKEIAAKYGPERLSVDFVQLTTSPKP